MIVEKHHTSSIEENISTGEDHIECPKNFVPTKHHKEKISSADAAQFTFLRLSCCLKLDRHMTPMSRKKPSQQPEVVFHRLTGWSMWTAHYLYRAPTNSLLIMVKASKSKGTACFNTSRRRCATLSMICVFPNIHNLVINLNVLLLMK